MVFFNNTSNSKTDSIFSPKSKLRRIYSTFKDCEAVSKVDGDCTDDEKRKIFDDFENEYSNTKVVMGTKLLSNGLDCKSVQFICLVDCYVNCVDYLQMVGRIRDWGYVKVLNVEGKKGFIAKNELDRKFPPINWKMCLSETVANFYDVPYKGHDGCCGAKKGDERIDELIEKLKNDTTENLYNNEVIVIDDSEDDSDDETVDISKLIRRIHEMLWKEGPQILMKTWKHVLGEDHLQSTEELFLYLNPRYIVTWSDEISSLLCDDCLMPLQDDHDCGYLGKVIGNLVYEYLAIQKVIKRPEAYIPIKNELIKCHACLFLNMRLRSKKESVRRDFTRMHDAISRPPKFADDEGICPWNPVENFEKYFALIFRRKINPVLVVYKGIIDYCRPSYFDISDFYSSVFRDAANINQIAKYNDSAMFAMYKKQALLDVEVRFRESLDQDKELELDELLDGINLIPIVVTMIWALFESGQYSEIAEKYVTLDHFEYPDTFPVFFKYMCSWVTYRRRKVPLFAIFLGIQLSNTSTLAREYRLEEMSSREKDR